MTEESQPAGDAASPPAVQSAGSPAQTAGPAAQTADSAAQIEPWLREILRCPQCRSTLTDGFGPDGPELHCTSAECRRAYRIDDGIPVLLVDESRSLAN